MNVALIDGDILCYRIGFSCDDESWNVAKARMNLFLSELVCKLPVTEWEVHLTGKGNFRDDYAVTVPYKGNRKKLKKPVHLKDLRTYLQEDWDASVSAGEEADDTISIRATTLGDDSIIVSLDKDFDQVQGWHYNFVKDDLYYVTEQEGEFNFYCQFLVGDTIDNIQGVRGIGPVKAAKLLADKTSAEMYAVCVELLGEERAIENGHLLYLRRTEGEVWQPPQSEERNAEQVEHGQKADTSNT